MVQRPKGLCAETILITRIRGREGGVGERDEVLYQESKVGSGGLGRK